MRIVLSQNRPLPNEKAEAVVAKLVEFLGLNPEDVFILHGFSLQMVDVPDAEHRAKEPAKDKAEHKAEHPAKDKTEFPAEHLATPTPAPTLPSAGRTHGHKEPHK